MADPAVGYDGNPIDPTTGGTPGSGFNVKDLAALGSLAPLIINMLKGSSQPNPGALLGTLPGGQDLLNGVVGQQQQQAPLRQAVTQQAMNMLPNSAYPGGRPTLAPVGQGPAPVAGGGGVDWGKLLAAGAGGAGLGAALAKMSGPGSGGPLGPIAKALWGLLHHGGKTSPWQGPVNNEGFNRPPTDLNPNMFPGFNDPNNDPFSGRQPTPNVDTNTTFNGVQGGYPNNPEDPSSIDPNWGGLTGGGGGDNYGTDWSED